MENNKNNYCNNCFYPISKKTTYCSKCSQKNTDGRISIGEFFSVFLSTVFNLESKFFQSLRDIFIPGKLTSEWFKGKHKRYFHPVRLFIISALLLVALVSYQVEKSDRLSKIEQQAVNAIKEKQFLAKLDSVQQITASQFQDKDKVQMTYDSVYKAMSNTAISDTISSDSIKMDEGIVIIDYTFNEKISNEDFVNLSLDEMADKYKVEGFVYRLFFKQTVKMIKDSESFATFVISNSIWIILLMMPFLALILKLIYIRGSWYYVEHLVFSFHTHAFVFIFLFLYELSSNILEYFFPDINLGFLTGIVFIFLFVYLFMALRRVYEQGNGKTFLKLLLLNFVYLIIFLFFLVFGFIAGMALF